MCLSCAAVFASTFYIYEYVCIVSGVRSCCEALMTCKCNPHALVKLWVHARAYWMATEMHGRPASRPSTEAHRHRTCLNVCSSLSSLLRFFLVYASDPCMWNIIEQLISKKWQSAQAPRDEYLALRTCGQQQLLGCRIQHAPTSRMHVIMCLLCLSPRYICKHTQILRHYP